MWRGRVVGQNWRGHPVPSSHKPHQQHLIPRSACVRIIIIRGRIRDLSEIKNGCSPHSSCSHCHPSVCVCLNVCVYAYVCACVSRAPTTLATVPPPVILRLPGSAGYQWITSRLFEVSLVSPRKQSVVEIIRLHCWKSLTVRHYFLFFFFHFFLQHRNPYCTFLQSLFLFFATLFFQNFLFFLLTIFTLYLTFFLSFFLCFIFFFLEFSLCNIFMLFSLFFLSFFLCLLFYSVTFRSFFLSFFACFFIQSHFVLSFFRSFFLSFFLCLLFYSVTFRSFFLSHFFLSFLLSRIFFMQ